MPDDLRIPDIRVAQQASPARAPAAPSYRARRAPSEGSTRLLVIAAAALGGLLLLGMAGWALMGRHPAAVPVIEADTRPLRVKPDNPGGMQVAGADEQVLGGGSAGANQMAPVAETPAPQALRAQMQATAPTPAPPPPAAPPSTAVAPPRPAPTAGPSPLPDTPARPQAAPQPGRTQVQLGAVDTQAAAQAEWARLAKRMPDLLNERRPLLQKAERDGHTVWRVRTGGFTDVADATSFCTRIRAKGAPCAIASF